MVRALFVMEQQVGHRTYYQNLRRFIEDDARLESAWVLVSYSPSARLWERLPSLPARLRGALRGRDEVRTGITGYPHGVAFYNTQVPAALGGRLARRVPYVLSTDITPLQYDRARIYGHRPDSPGLLRAYKHGVNTVTFRHAARLFPWSTWTRDSLVSEYGVDAQQTEVLPPGVDLALWTPGPARCDGPPRILFVGGDLRRKGGDLLLEAWRALGGGQNLELHIVTRTPLAPQEGLFVYQDMQPNSPALVNLYRSCDLFVLPTQAEAFGIAAVEACAAGLPVIASRVGGLVDVVAEGETGMLVEPGDVGGLTERIRMLAGDAGLCARMGSAARARAEARFDARRNAERIVDILLQVAASGRGGAGE
jgi:glycosyltransferase involved in cell wall biosynthesis